MTHRPLVVFSSLGALVFASACAGAVRVNVPSLPLAVALADGPDLATTLYLVDDNAHLPDPLRVYAVDVPNNHLGARQQVGEAQLTGVGRTVVMELRKGFARYFFNVEVVKTAPSPRPENSAVLEVKIEEVTIEVKPHHYLTPKAYAKQSRPAAIELPPEPEPEAPAESSSDPTAEMSDDVRDLLDDGGGRVETSGHRSKKIVRTGAGEKRAHLFFELALSDRREDSGGYDVATWRYTGESFAGDPDLGDSGEMVRNALERALTEAIRHATQTLVNRGAR